MRGFGITPGGSRRPTFPCPTPWNRRNTKGGLLLSASSVSSLLFEVTIKREQLEERRKRRERNRRKEKEENRGEDGNGVGEKRSKKGREGRERERYES